MGILLLPKRQAQNKRFFFINDKKSKRSLVYDQLSGQIIEVIYYENGSLVRRLRVNRYDRNNDKYGLWLWFNPQKTVILEGTFRKKSPSWVLSIL